MWEIEWNGFDLYREGAVGAEMETDEGRSWGGSGIRNNSIQEIS